MQCDLDSLLEEGLPRSSNVMFGSAVAGKNDDVLEIPDPSDKMEMDFEEDAFGRLNSNDNWLGTSLIELMESLPEVKPTEGTPQSSLPEVKKRTPPPNSPKASLNVSSPESCCGFGGAQHSHSPRSYQAIKDKLEQELQDLRNQPDYQDVYNEAIKKAQLNLMKNHRLMRLWKIDPPPMKISKTISKKTTRPHK